MKKFNLSHFLEIAIISLLLVLAGCSFNTLKEADIIPTPANDYTVGTAMVAIVDLGTAGDYAVLAKSGVSTTGTTAITGNVGLSPADHTYLTGFSETMDASNVFSTSIYVVGTGKLYAADYAVPTPANLTTAVSDMETAYTTAAGLATPDYIDLGAGEIGGLTLAPGLYKWGTGVGITTDVTISGSETDTWVFQIAEDLTVASGVNVILSGGALCKNIIWQIGSSASIGTGAHMEGVILSMTAITMDTGATLNGRLLSQSAVTMDANTVTEPPITTGISK
jgi:hypothetical protein